MFIKTMIAVFFMVLSGAAAAQINKCMNAAGKVVAYGADCPAGTRSEATNIKSSPAPTGAAPQKSTAERDADFRKRQIEKQEATAKAEKNDAGTEQRKRACDSSRVYLKGLQERQRIPKTDPKTGERTFLTDAEYPAEIARAQRGVSENCK